MFHEQFEICEWLHQFLKILLSDFEEPETTALLIREDIYLLILYLLIDFFCACFWQVKRVIKLLHDSGPFKDGID